MDLTLHNPWRHLAVHHPDVRVVWTRLPGTMRGWTDGTVILIDDRLTQAQRRVTVCHETLHIERGIIPADTLEECRVERLVAVRLITTEQLIDALRWQRHPSIAGLADLLWVDRVTVERRLESLTPAEQAQIDAAIRDVA